MQVLRLLSHHRYTWAKLELLIEDNIITENRDWFWGRMQYTYLKHSSLLPYCFQLLIYCHTQEHRRTTYIMHKINHNATSVLRLLWQEPGGRQQASVSQIDEPGKKTVRIVRRKEIFTHWNVSSKLKVDELEKGRWKFKYLNFKVRSATNDNR